MKNPLGHGPSVGSPSQPLAGTNLLIFLISVGPAGAGTLWGGVLGETSFPKALLNLFNHALSPSRHLKNSAKGWGREFGDTARE